MFDQVHPRPVCNTREGGAGLWLYLVICALSVVVEAHAFSQSESRLAIDGRTVRVRLSLNLLEMKGVDANQDQRVSYDELDNAIEPLFAAVKEHYTLRAPELPRRVVAEKYQIIDDHVLQIDMLQTFERDVRRLEATSNLDALLGPAHQHLATAIVNGEPRRAVLDAANRTLIVEVARVTVGRIVTVVLAVAGLLLLIAYRLKQRPR